MNSNRLELSLRTVRKCVSLLRVRESHSIGVTRGANGWGFSSTA
jgi:hypothetical protein